MVLRVHNRALLRDARGQLHRPQQVTMGGTKAVYGWAADPQLDYVWLTEAEWRSLVPTNPSVGAARPVPPKLVQRILTFHLLDKAIGTPQFFWPDPTGAMTLTVEEASEKGTRLRLEGTADMRPKQGGYPVRFLGRLEYDPKKKALTRFDVVALGADGGEFRTEEERANRFSMLYTIPAGHRPLLAAAFELVDPAAPLNRVPPYAVMYNSAKAYNLPYFTPE